MGRPSRYPDEFRHEAVQMALASSDSSASIARRLGVNETTLRNWVANELAEQARQANPLSVSPSEFEELRRLRREVAELRVEKARLSLLASWTAECGTTCFGGTLIERAALRRHGRVSSRRLSRWTMHGGSRADCGTSFEPSIRSRHCRRVCGGSFLRQDNFYYGKVTAKFSMAGQDAAHPLTSWHDDGAKPRSLAFDVFGDYVRFNGDELSLRAMVELLRCFDVAEATTRIMMSRLRAAGAFSSRREGRETIYRLTAAGVDILEESRQRIFDRQQTQWSGSWSLVLYTVPETDRAARERLRRSLQWLGFGQLTAGTWISAHDRLADVRLALRAEGSVRLDQFRASSVSRENDRELAARCWDLETLDSRYQELVYLVGKRQPHYRRGLTDRDAFIARLRLVHKYRMSIYDDPNLPRELLPIGWIGSQAHDAFTETHDLLRPGAEAFFLQVARGLV